MSVYTSTGPFYFALTTPDDNTFDPTRHNQWDLQIFDFTRTLEEGQIPKLELTILNPLRGLLDPDYNVWGWFSYHDVIHDVWYPLFWGRLVGQPKELIGMKLGVEMISMPLDYYAQKSRIASALKVDPFYDPVCLKINERTNPDAIIETYSKVYHVDHLTGVVTVSDILEGEDGNVNFTADQTLYNFLSQTVEQPPLTAILMEMNTSWKQTWRGYVTLPDFATLTYTGDGMISEWPKPLASLGGGYTVFDSACWDYFAVNRVQTVSFSWSWSSTEKEHTNGDVISASWSTSFPVFYGPHLEMNILEKQVIGICDPYAVDEDGDPAPLNKPASAEVNTLYAPLWSIYGTITVRVQADRQRTERIVMTLNGNFQPVLVDPTVQQNAETKTLSLEDVGQPIFEPLDWFGIAGQPVELDMVVFPDNIFVLGGTSAQVITDIGSGTAAPFNQQPAFSDIPGVITTDANGVQYTSLGNTNPTYGNNDWQSTLSVSGGTIILPRQPSWVTYTSLIRAGILQFPRVGTSVGLRTIVRAANLSYWVCTIAGVTDVSITGVKPDPFGGNTSWGTTIVDGGATWRCLGLTIPTGNDFFLARADGVTGGPYLIPSFNTSSLHAKTTDGTITWIYIGTGEIPVGGTVENVTGDCYFPQDRGQRSLRYGICWMRARMLYRARCVPTKFQVSFLDGINVTTRMTSTIAGERRIPGGGCAGKNTLCVLSGKHGAYRTEITMKSCVGFEETITPVQGTPVYAQDGVFQDGVQQYTGSVILVETLTDVGYTPPVRQVVDDGVTFPILDSSAIILNDSIVGTIGDQAGGIIKAFNAAKLAATLPYEFIPTTIGQMVTLQQRLAVLGSDTMALELSKTPIYRNLQLKPLDTGVYGGYYILKLTDQQGPQQINLAAPP